MLALIGGTGLTRMKQLEVVRRHDIITDWGSPSASPLQGKLAETDVLFLARHGDPHVLLPHQVNYRANIAALKEAGATAIVAINAVGGISGGASSGRLVVPDQIIDYTSGRDSTYFDRGTTPVVHVDFTWPFDAALRKALLLALEECGEDCLAGGCYAATQGPRLETAAEITRLERDGADVVGMTGMPEAVLARELEIPYAMLSLVVNPAAGKSDEEITMQQIEQVVHQGMGRVTAVLLKLAQCYRY